MSWVGFIHLKVYELNSGPKVRPHAWYKHLSISNTHTVSPG